MTENRLPPHLYKVFKLLPLGMDLPITGADIEQFKRTQAPYCISGKVTADKKGTCRRNNNSLVYRDLIFLDFDEQKANVFFEAHACLLSVFANDLIEFMLDMFMEEGEEVNE